MPDLFYPPPAWSYAFRLGHTLRTWQQYEDRATVFACSCGFRAWLWDSFFHLDEPEALLTYYHHDAANGGRDEATA